MRRPNCRNRPRKRIAGADIILYGPGTQHSSLLSQLSHRGPALAAAPAPVKALVMNLDSDNDIQGLSASDVADRAFAYGALATHILVNDDAEPSAHGRIGP